MSTLSAKLSLFFTALWLNSWCQNEIPDDLINKTVLIEIQNIGSGSGFFYNDSINTYFITALHVVADEVIDNKTHKVIDHKLKGKTALISWYPRNPEKASANKLEINLETLYQNGDLKADPKNDLVVFRIGDQIDLGYPAVGYREGITKIEGGKSRINAFQPTMVSRIDSIKYGNEVIVLGYPKSLGLKEIPLYDFNRPLLRKGVVAGINKDQKTFIIDCPTYGGNSGGPVILIVDNILSVDFYLIGFVSKFIPLQEIWYNPNYNIRNIELVNSGYSVIIPIDPVLQLIEQFQ